MADLDSIEEARRKAQAEAQNVRAADYSERGLPTANEYTPGASSSIPLVGTQPQSFDRYNPQPGISTATGNQGLLSPDEQKFWAANPNGAVKDPQTGNLVGLGNAAPALPPVDENGMVTVNSGLGPPAVPYNDQTRINTGLGPSAGRFPTQDAVPDFVHIPQIDPNVLSQRRNIQNEIATTMRELNTASSVRPRGGISQREILNQKLSQLTQANNSLGAEHYRQSQLQTAATLKNSDLQEKYRVGRDVLGATKAFMGIQSAPGTPEHARELAQISLNYPESMKDKTFESKLMSAAQYHKGQEASRQQAIANGLIPVDTGYGQRGATTKYMTPEQHSAYQLNGINKELKAKGLPFDVNAIFNPLGGHKATDEKKSYDQLGPNDTVQVPYATQSGKLDSVEVRKSTLESLKSQYGDRYKAAGGEFPTAVPPAGGGGTPPPGQIKSDEEFNSLPSGSIFVDPNGVKRRKP